MKSWYPVLATLLLLCLAAMPYGYYVLVRFVAMILFALFALFAYEKWQKEQPTLAIVFGALSLLFQPFVKIALGRAMWNFVDVVVAVGLLALWLKGDYKEKH